eukprot:m.135774 g.135774  ORF g.135774 m.135774 type:complete len:166 (+) comp38166_c0_seq2:849-1346(+)
MGYSHVNWFYRLIRSLDQGKALFVELQFIMEDFKGPVQRIVSAFCGISVKLLFHEIIPGGQRKFEIVDDNKEIVDAFKKAAEKLRVMRSASGKTLLKCLMVDTEDTSKLMIFFFGKDMGPKGLHLQKGEYYAMKIGGHRLFPLEPSPANNYGAGIAFNATFNVWK